MNPVILQDPVPTRTTLLPWTVVIGAFTLGLLRLGGLVRDASINVLYADQWDFLSPLFLGQGPLACFLYQHGPHRQGLGGAIQWALYNTTSWDVRAEAWCEVVVLLVGALAATAVAARLRGRLSAFDAIFPLVILSPLHWETILLTTNLAHSILPLGLLLLLCLAWLIRSSPQRLAAVGLIAGMCIFTGFGFCVAFPVIAVALAMLGSSTPTSAERRTGAVILGMICGGLVLFFIGYRWDPAIPGWTFPVNDWWNYGTFVGYMIATLVGLREKTMLAATVGGGLFLIILAVFVTSLVRVWRRESPDRSAVVALLTGTSLAYAGLTAYGRLPVNLEAAFMWRYTTLMMPAALGLILHLQSWAIPSASRQESGCASLAMILVGASITFNFTPDRLSPALAARKHRWTQAYLQTKDADQANALSEFWVYPQPSNPAHIVARLRWLEERQLSFFSTTPAPINKLAEE